MASKCKKCASCHKWFIADEEVVLNDGETYHRECIGGGGGSSVKSPELNAFKSPEGKMSFAQEMSTYGGNAYANEKMLDKIHYKVLKRFPTKSSFKNARKDIMAMLKQGFPQEVQDLLNGTAQAARDSGREMERENERGRLYRILARLKKHTYTGFPQDSDDEDSEDETAKNTASAQKDAMVDKKQEEEEVAKDINNVPVARAVENDVIVAEVVPMRLNLVPDSDEDEDESDDDYV